MRSYDTKTKADAFDRVANARLGALSNMPTKEYLEHLRYLLLGWVTEIESELQAIHERDLRAGRNS